MPGTESVRVVVRVRPLNQSELNRGCQSVIDVDRSANQVSIYHNRSTQPKTFAFDAVYDPDSEQQQIYDETGFPLVENVLEGYNGTIFAYGQTGCGKTFTMSGTNEKPGVIPNSFKHIFGAISDTDSTKMFLVYCSYIEIYNEEIRDLLKYDPKTRLELKEDKDHGVYIKSVTKESVNNIQDINRFMEIGASHRTTKETMMNERSSRSHSIFTVYVEMSEILEDGPHLRAGKLNLVDLAGSERQKKTQATGDRLKEAIEINLSLSALGNVISALVDGQSTHIPYRDSKLTRLLQDSLGGNTKTIMIAVASPADYNYDESLSSLRYASRAKFIQNKPRINEDPKDALLREYLEEITKLKRMLAERGGAGETMIVEKVVERIVEKRVEVKVPVYIEASGDPQSAGSVMGKKASRKTIGDDATAGDSSNQGSARTKVRGESERKGGTLTRKAKAVLEDDDEDSGADTHTKPAQSTKKRDEMKLVQRDLADDNEEDMIGTRPAAVANKAGKAAQRPQARGIDASEGEEESKTPVGTAKTTGKAKGQAKVKESDDELKPAAARPAKTVQRQQAKAKDDNPYDEESKTPGGQPQKQKAASKLLDDSDDELARSPVTSAPKQLKPGHKGPTKSKEVAPGKIPGASPKAGKQAVLESDSGNYSEDFPEEYNARGEEKTTGKSGANEAGSRGKRLTGEAEETTTKAQKAGKAKRDEPDASKPAGSRPKGQKPAAKADGLAGRAGSVEATGGHFRGEEGRQGGQLRNEEGKQGRSRDSGNQGTVGAFRTAPSDLPLEDDSSDADQYADDFEADQQSLHRPAPAKGSQKTRKDADGQAIQLSTKRPKGTLQPQQSKSQEEFEDYGDDFEEEAAERKAALVPSESAGRMVAMRGGKDAKQEAVRESKEQLKGTSKDVAKSQAPSESSKGKRPADTMEPPKKPSRKGQKSTIDDVSDEDRPQQRARKVTVKVNADLSNPSSDNELEESVQEKEARFMNIRQKVMKGGQTQDQEELNRLKQYHREQLKRQKAALTQPRQDKKKSEEEQLLSDHQYASVQEEVENQRHIVKSLQLKYKSAMSEIQDLNHEHEIEKEDLLNTVRAKDRESNFLYQVLEKLISTDQLNMIKQKSKFDDDNNEWRVPAFLVQTNKPLTFPKLPRRQAQELVETDVKGRSIKFQEEDDEDVGLRNARFQDWKKGDDRKRGESQPGMDERGAPGGGNMKAVLLDPLEQAPVAMLPEPGGKNTPQSRKRLQPLNDPGRQMLASDEFPKAGKRSYIS